MCTLADDTTSVLDCLYGRSPLGTLFFFFIHATLTPQAIWTGRF